MYITRYSKGLQEHDGKNWKTEEELLPSGHQAPKHKPSLIITYKIVTEKHTYSHHPYFFVYIPWTTRLHIPPIHITIY